jgi:hypothetical protein
MATTARYPGEFTRISNAYTPVDESFILWRAIYARKGTKISLLACGISVAYNQH